MLTHGKLTAVAVGLILISGGSARAQGLSPVTFAVGGGFTEPMRYSNGPLNVGYNFTGDLGFRPSATMGLAAEFGFNHMGISRSTLDALAVPNGSTRIYSLTLQPIYHTNPHGRVDPYITLGGGYYRRTVEFTEPSTALVTGFNPFFGFFPVVVPAQTVLGSFTQNKGGLNGGLGLGFRVKNDSVTQIFAEVRYHHIFTSGRDTNYLPVTFGVRW